MLDKIVLQTKLRVVRLEKNVLLFYFDMTKGS